MVIKTVQTLVFEYPEDYQAEIEWNKKRDGDWVHQSTDTICSVYTLTNNYIIPTKAKHSFVDNPYFEVEPQTCADCKHDAEPQTETEIARAIVHKMIDDAVIAEDAYPDLRQKMHDAVDEYEPQRDCLTCRYNSDEWDSPKCDNCSKAHSNYEPQTDCAWREA